MSSLSDLRRSARLVALPAAAGAYAATGLVRRWRGEDPDDGAPRPAHPQRRAHPPHPRRAQGRRAQGRAAALDGRGGVPVRPRGHLARGAHRDAGGQRRAALRRGRTRARRRARPRLARPAAGLRGGRGRRRVARAGPPGELAGAAGGGEGAVPRRPRGAGVRRPDHLRRVSARLPRRPRAGAAAAGRRAARPAHRGARLRARGPGAGALRGRVRRRPRRRRAARAARHARGCS